MRSIFKYSTLEFLVLSIFIFSFSKAEDTDEENDPECQYIKNMLGLVQKQAAQLPICAAEGNFRTVELRNSNYMCIIKCSLTKLGIVSPLGQDGNIDIIGAMEFMETAIPPNMKNDSGDMMMKCQEAAGKIDPTDSTCMSYQPMVKCALDSIVSNLRAKIPKILGSTLAGGGINGLTGNNGGGIAGRIGKTAGGGIGGVVGNAAGGIGGIVGSGVGSRLGNVGGGIAGKLLKCGALAGRLESELSKMNIDGLRRLF